MELKGRKFFKTKEVVSILQEAENQGIENTYVIDEEGKTSNILEIKLVPYSGVFLKCKAFYSGFPEMQPEKKWSLMGRKDGRP